LDNIEFLLNFERLLIEPRLTCRFLSLTIDIESQTKNFSMWAVGTFDIESSSRSLKSLIRPFLVINLIKRFRFGHELKHLENYSGINWDILSSSQKGIGKRPGNGSQFKNPEISGYTSTEFSMCRGRQRCQGSLIDSRKLEAYQILHYDINLVHCQSNM